MRSVALLLLMTFGLHATAQYLGNDLPLMSNNFYMDNPAAVSENHQMNSSFYFNSNFYDESVNGSFLHTSDLWMDDKHNVGVIGFYKNEDYQEQFRFALSFTRVIAINDVQLKVGIRPTYIKSDLQDYYYSQGISAYYDKFSIGLGSVMEYNHLEVGASVGPYTSISNLITSNGLMNPLHANSLNIYGKYEIRLHPNWTISPFGRFMNTINLKNLNVRNYLAGFEFGFKEKVEGWINCQVIEAGIDDLEIASIPVEVGVKAEVYEGISIHYQYSYLMSLIPAPFDNHLFGLSFKMGKEE